MNESPFADVERNVRKRFPERVEEQQIPGSKCFGGDRATDLTDGFRLTRKVFPKGAAKHVLHQTAAVKTVRRIVATQSVRNTEKTQRVQHHFGTTGNRRRDLRPCD